MKKIGVLLLVGLFAVTCVGGCTNIKDDQTRTKTEGTAVGAGAGAVIGGLLGQLIGGDTAGTLIGAAVGALAGAGAGYAYGSHVANEKSKYAKREDWLNACIASAQKVNADTRAYNDQLAQQVQKLDKETKALAAAYQKRQVKEAQLEKEQVKVDKQLASAKDKLERAKAELDMQEKVLADAEEHGNKKQAVALDKQIKQLKAQINELEGHTESLASISARMSV